MSSLKSSNSNKAFLSYQLQHSKSLDTTTKVMVSIQGTKQEHHQPLIIKAIAILLKHPPVSLSTRLLPPLSKLNLTKATTLKASLHKPFTERSLGTLKHTLPMEELPKQCHKTSQPYRLIALLFQVSHILRFRLTHRMYHLSPLPPLRSMTLSKLCSPSHRLHGTNPLMSRRSSSSEWFTWAGPQSLSPRSNRVLFQQNVLVSYIKI